MAKLPAPGGDPYTYPGHSGVDFLRGPAWHGKPFYASGPGRVLRTPHNVRGGWWTTIQYDNGATIREDAWIRSRVAACAALEGVEAPAQWAVQHKWDIAIQPGWAASWESALVDAPEGFEPGKQDNVITDAMILSTVQVIIAQEDSPPEAA